MKAAITVVLLAILLPATRGQTHSAGQAWTLSSDAAVDPSQHYSEI